MRREDRRHAERVFRRSQAHRAKAGALAVASLALVPFLSSGGVPGTVASTMDNPVVGVDGGKPQQPALSPDLLAVAGSPAQLIQQLPSFADVPITPLGAPVIGALGIPASALAAYRRAEQEMAGLAPQCHLSWSLLASIGRIESNHARGGRVDSHGAALAPILGPVLDGAGVATVADTDRGALDGNTQWDRAVGPMQFIPNTWRHYASDGNGDGAADPENIYDAALAAGKFLCAGGGDLRDPQQRAQAVFRYNQSDSYVRTVLLWADAYARGASSVPDGQLPPGPIEGNAGLPGPIVEAPPVPVPPLPPGTPATTTPPPATTPGAPTTSTTPPAGSTTATTKPSTSSPPGTTTWPTTTAPSGPPTSPTSPTCPPPSSTTDTTTPASTTSPQPTTSTTPVPPPPCG